MRYLAQGRARVRIAHLLLAGLRRRRKGAGASGRGGRRRGGGRGHGGRHAAKPLVDLRGRQAFLDEEAALGLGRRRRHLNKQLAKTSMMSLTRVILVAS